MAQSLSDRSSSSRLYKTFLARKGLTIGGDEPTRAAADEGTGSGTPVEKGYRQCRRAGGVSFGAPMGEVRTATAAAAEW